MCRRRRRRRPRTLASAGRLPQARCTCPGSLPQQLGCAGARRARGGAGAARCASWSRAPHGEQVAAASPRARCSPLPKLPTRHNMLYASLAALGGTPTATLLPALAVLAQRAPFAAAAFSGAQEVLARRGTSTSAGCAAGGPPLAPPALPYAAAAGAPNPNIFSLVQPRRRQQYGLHQVRGGRVWGWELPCSAGRAIVRPALLPAPTAVAARRPPSSAAHQRHPAVPHRQP